MDKFYIKEGDSWLGPLSEIEFEFRKAGKDSFEYWKPEFCENHILHPSLCSHSKTWVKPLHSAGQKTRTEIQESEIAHTSVKKDVILNARPLEPDDEKVIEGDQPKQVEGKKPEDPVKRLRHDSREPGTLFKIVVIIIGFLLVLGAGYYVNSNMSVLFYQDIIIQESVKNMEYFTRDMVDETKSIKTEIDSLNTKMDKQYNSISKALSEIRKNLENTKNQ